MVQIVAHFGHETPSWCAALQYVLRHDVIAAVIPGFRNKHQVETNLQGADKHN